MVNATELRIGNKLLLDGRIVTVNKIDDCREEYHNDFLIGNYEDLASYPSKEYEPITLTLDILERFGLETSSYVGTGDFQMCGIEIFKTDNFSYKIRMFASDYDTWHLEYITNPFYDISLQKNVKVNIKPFKFLHQLQNLWLDITGEDLTTSKPERAH